MLVPENIHIPTTEGIGNGRGGGGGGGGGGGLKTSGNLRGEKG